MTWVKIDDRFYDNPKNRTLGPAGRDLFIAGLTYCAKGLTDGDIPKADVPLILAQAQAKRSTVEKLLDAGRWLDMGDHLEVAEYLTYQPSKAKVLADRERERKKKQRQRAEADDFGPVPDHVPPGTTQGTPEGESPLSSRGPRSRPVPSTDVDRPGVSVLVTSDREPAFDAWWEHYPRKVAKGAARAAFGKALKKTTLDDLIAAAIAYADLPGRETRYTKHPATWLNDECWNDDNTPTRTESNGTRAAKNLVRRNGTTQQRELTQ